MNRLFLFLILTASVFCAELKAGSKESFVAHASENKESFVVNAPTGPGGKALVCYEYGTIRWEASKMPVNTKYFNVDLYRNGAAIDSILRQFPQSDVGLCVSYFWNNPNILPGGHYYIKIAALDCEMKLIGESDSDEFEIPACNQSPEYDLFQIKFMNH